jgi:hypothetical protein
MTGPHRETNTRAVVSELRRIQDLTWARRHTEALAAANALLRRVPSQRGVLYFSALNQRLLDQLKDACGRTESCPGVELGDAGTTAD